MIIFVVTSQGQVAHGDGAEVVGLQAESYQAADRRRQLFGRVTEAVI